MRKVIQILIIGIFSVALSSCGTKKSSSKPNTSKARVSPELVFKKAFHEAMRLKLIGKYEQSQQAFEHCLSLQPNNGGVNFALSELSSYKNDHTSAIQFGEKASETDPNNRWYSLNLALLYQKTGDHKKAAKAYEKALNDEQENINLWFAYSDALIYSEDYNKAIEAYNKIEEKMGVIPEISLRKHQIYAEQGNWDQAEQEIKNLIASNPKNPQFLGILAEYYMKRNQIGKSKSVLDIMLEMDPTSGTTHLSLADYYAKQNNLESMKNHVLKAFSAEDLDIETKMKIILSNYDRIGKPGDLGKTFSYQLLDTLVKAHEEEAKVYAVYADYDQIYKRIRNARDMYLKAVSLDNSKYPIWNQLLLLSANLTDYDTLYTQGKKAIELFPTQPMLYLLTGLGAYESGKSEEAIEILNAGKNYILNEELMKAEFEFQLAQAFYKEEQYEESFKSFEKAISLDPNSPLFLNNYAYKLALRKKDLFKAEELVKRAIDLAPENSTYMDTYGWIFFQMGKYNEALKWISKSLEGLANAADIHEHYGDVLIKLNDKSGALKAWNKSKELGNISEILEKKINTGQFHE